MALRFVDRVKELSTLTGTGAIPLEGAVLGHRAFSAVLAEGDTLYYGVDDAVTGGWEIGLGRYTALPDYSPPAGLEFGIDGGAHDVAISPNSEFVAAPLNLASDNNTENALRVYDTTTVPGELTPVDLSAYTEKIAELGDSAVFSPDSSLLYLIYRSGSFSGLVHVISTATWTLQSNFGFSFSPRGTAISPDGTMLAIVNNDGGFRVLLTDGTEVADVAVGTSRDVEFSPDGTMIAVLRGSSTAQPVSVFSTADWTEIVGPDTTAFIGGGIAWSPNGANLAVSKRGTTHLVVYNVADWSVVAGTAPGTNSSPSGLTYSADGTKLLIVGFSDYSFIDILDTTSWETTASVYYGFSSIERIHYAPNGLFYVGSSSNRFSPPPLSAFTAADNTPMNPLLTDAYADEPHGVTLSRDGSMIAFANSGYLTIRGIPDNNVIYEYITGSSSDIAGDVVRFSPDGTKIVFQSASSPRLFVRDIATGDLVAGTPVISSTIHSFEFSPDGTYLAIGIQGVPYLYVYEVATWTLAHEFQGVLTDDVDAVAWSPDGAYLAVGSRGGNRFYVHNTADWTLVAGTPAFTLSIYYMEFTPDGSRLVTMANSSPHLNVIQVSDWTVEFSSDALSNGFVITPEGDAILCNGGYSVDRFGIPGFAKTTYNLNNPASYYAMFFLDVSPGAVLFSGYDYPFVQIRNADDLTAYVPESGPRITRAGTVNSSSTGATVDFVAGDKEVYLTLPSEAILGYATLSMAQAFTAAQSAPPVTLTSTANTVAINLALRNNFSHTLTENTTLAAPSNPVEGQSGVITLIQDAITARTLAYNTFWKFEGGTVPATSTTLGSRSSFVYYVDDAGATATCNLIGPVS